MNKLLEKILLDLFLSLLFYLVIHHNATNCYRQNTKHYYKVLNTWGLFDLLLFYNFFWLDVFYWELFGNQILNNLLVLVISYSDQLSLHFLNLHLVSSHVLDFLLNFSYFLLCWSSRCSRVPFLWVFLHIFFSVQKLHLLIDMIVQL